MSKFRANPALRTCAICCCPFAAVAAVLLALFGLLFRNANVTLSIVAEKNGWDLSQKAAACFGAAALYGVVAVCCALGMIAERVSCKGGSSKRTPLTAHEEALAHAPMRSYGASPTDSVVS